MVSASPADPAELVAQNHRIDNDLSERAFGLDHKAALIMKEVFRNTPEHAVIPTGC